MPHYCTSLRKCDAFRTSSIAECGGDVCSSRCMHAWVACCRQVCTRFCLDADADKTWADSYSFVRGVAWAVACGRQCMATLPMHLQRRVRGFCFYCTLHASLRTFSHMALAMV